MQQIDISIESTACLFYNSITSTTRKSSVHSTISASDAKSSTFHREWRCSQLTATDFCHRQPPGCIWSFHGRMQQPDNQTTASASDDIGIRCSFDNQTIVNASNLIAIECSNSGINSLSSDRDGAECNVSDIETIVSVHSIISALNAVLITNNFVSASDRFTVGCSSPDIETIVSASDDIGIRCSPDNFINKQPPACIWPFHDRMQQFWHHIQPPVHLMASASDAALTIKQPPEHLIVSRSNAASLTSKSTACLPTTR